MKSVIIFGGSGGIGSAITQTLKHLGFAVAIADIRPTDTKVADFFIPTNATREVDIKRAISTAQEKFGSIDVVINCQGVYFVDKIENTPVEEFDKMIDTNLRSVFLVCKNVVPLMKFKKSGYIVNLASMAGLRGKAGEGAYCASKFGVVGLTDALFEELKGTGVRVTAVCPTSVDTPFLNKAVELSEEELEKILRPSDIGRIVGELVTSHPRVLRKIVPIEIEIEIDKLKKKK